mmetsp:Transcript_20351/g.40350  ORF Transcript_20351/g.40350 Transcript_20351/m.40350 type:complete len:105 (+) Transcript_20351:1172-1486(+)
MSILFPPQNLSPPDHLTSPLLQSNPTKTDPPVSHATAVQAAVNIGAAAKAPVTDADLALDPRPRHQVISAELAIMKETIIIRPSSEEQLLFVSSCFVQWHQQIK